MSVEGKRKQIRLGRRFYLALRLPLCLLAVPMALLSALSISVFRYIRGFADAAQFYTGEQTFLIGDCLTLPMLGIAALLWLFYVLALHTVSGRHLSSAVIALVLSFNTVVALSMEHSDLREIFLPTGPVGNALVLLGFLLLYYECIELIALACDFKTRYRIWEDEWDPTDVTLLFFGAFGIILLLWLPILFCCYPGSVHNDTRYQIMGWLGLKEITASHPILTTVFYGAFYQLGMAIGGQEKAVFLSLLCQDLFTAAAMGLSAAYVCRYTRSKVWFWITIAFFGLLPLWQGAAQVILKDVLHTGCFLLFVCAYLNCLRKREKSWGSVLLLFLAAVLVAYTRKATFYLAVICIAVAALYHWRNFLLPYLAMLGVFIGLFWFSNNILYPYLGISGEWESENYSLQFQQVALYCRTYQDEMSIDEIAIINDTLDFDTIVRDYTPMISDPVKSTFHDTWKDHSAFWQLYRQMLRRHPLIFVKAAIMGSFEHFNPWFEDINFNVYISREEDFLTVEYRSPLHQTLNHLWNESMHVPVLRLLLGTGLYAWILLIALGYAIRKKSGLAVLGLLPTLTLMAGLLMSHVNGNVRYGYPLIAAAPVSFAWVLYAISRRSPERPRRASVQHEQAASFRPRFLKSVAEQELEEWEFDPNQPPPELPPEKTNEIVRDWKPGPLLGFVMRYVPVPARPKTYLDFLKVLAIFLVLWNHTTTGFDLYNRVQDMPQHMLLLCASIFDKIAVPLFFMCSGALLLGREESWRRILTHRVRRFALILLVVSGINYLQYYNDSTGFSVYDFVSRLYTGSVRTPLWYLYSYLAFLLMLPFLRKLARCMRERDYLWLLGLFIVSQLLSAADFFWFHGENAHISDFRFFTSQNYVVYALWGFYIERVMDEKRMSAEMVTMLIMLSILSIGGTYVLTQWRMDYLGVWTANNSQDFFNTFIAIPSITVFYLAKLWFSRHPISGRKAAVWSLLATGTFGTYLFERFWRDNTEAVFHFLSGKIGSFASSLVHILAACALGILATLLYKIVTGMLKALFRRLTSRGRTGKKADITFTVPTEDVSDLAEMESLLVNNAHKNNNVWDTKGR